MRPGRLLDRGEVRASPFPASLAGIVTAIDSSPWSGLAALAGGSPRTPPYAVLRLGIDSSRTGRSRVEKVSDPIFGSAHPVGPRRSHVAASLPRTGDSETECRPALTRGGWWRRPPSGYAPRSSQPLPNMTGPVLRLAGLLQSVSHLVVLVVLVVAEGRHGLLIEEQGRRDLEGHRSVPSPISAEGRGLQLLQAVHAGGRAAAGCRGPLGLLCRTACPGRPDATVELILLTSARAATCPACFPGLVGGAGSSSRKVLAGRASGNGASAWWGPSSEVHR